MNKRVQESLHVKQKYCFITSCNVVLKINLYRKIKINNIYAFFLRHHGY